MVSSIRRFSSVAPVVLAGILALSGCATKKYVRLQTQALEPAIQEAVKTSRQRMPSALMPSTGALRQGIATAAAAAATADQKAVTAQQSAQTAQTAAQAAQQTANTANKGVQQANNRINTA